MSIHHVEGENWKLSHEVNFVVKWSGEGECGLLEEVACAQAVSYDLLGHDSVDGRQNAVVDGTGERKRATMTRGEGFEGVH